MKRPLVACLVGYAWVSELCTTSSNRQLGALNMSIPLINTSRDEVNLSTTWSQDRLTCISLILALCVHPKASRGVLFWANCNFPNSLFVALDHMTEQQSKCDQTRACMTCLVDSAVKKEEHHFIMDRLLPILVTVVSICFDHDRLQSRVTPSSLVTSTCLISTLFITIFSWGLVNDLSKIQCL